MWNGKMQPITEYFQKSAENMPKPQENAHYLDKMIVVIPWEMLYNIKVSELLNFQGAPLIYE